MEKQVAKTISEWLDQQSSKEKIAEAVADYLIENYTSQWNKDQKEKSNK